MVVAGEHVAGAQADVLQVAAVEHALAVLNRDAVGPCKPGRTEDAGGQQPPAQGLGCHVVERALSSTAHGESEDVGRGDTVACTQAR